MTAARFLYRVAFAFGVQRGKTGASSFGLIGTQIIRQYIKSMAFRLFDY